MLWTSSRSASPATGLLNFFIFAASFDTAKSKAIGPSTIIPASNSPFSCLAFISAPSTVACIFGFNFSFAAKHATLNSLYPNFLAPS